jgi:hypothetical protein
MDGPVLGHQSSPLGRHKELLGISGIGHLEVRLFAKPEGPGVFYFTNFFETSIRVKIAVLN